MSQRIYTARLLPLNLRDTDGVDPKVLLQTVMTGTEEFRDHCYVSITKNKHLQKFMKGLTKPTLISFNAKPFTYSGVKQSLSRISNITRVK